MPDFLPRASISMLGWSRNFDQKLMESPESFGISEAYALEYHQLHLGFEEAFQRAADPAVGGPAAIVAKSLAEKAARDFARRLVRCIRGIMTVTDAQRTTLGLRPRKPYSRIPAPWLPPRLRATYTQSRTIVLRLNDPQAPTRRGMPKDVRLAVVFYSVGETAPDSPKGWKEYGMTSRAYLKVELPSHIPSGSKVWFTAYWQNDRGRSAGAEAVYTHVGFGMALAG
jgi:hypothetical protein